MMSIDYRGFMISKGAISIGGCADSIAFNLDLQRFAVADGITKSYFPQFFARSLTDHFVNHNVPASVFFEDDNAETLNLVIDDWRRSCLEEEEKADEYTKDIYSLRWEYTPFGASTFAGLTIEKERFSLLVLGDSCIFFIPSNDTKTPEIFTSMPVEICKEEDDRWFLCKFGSNPHFIDTTGRIVGRPLNITASMQDGYFLIMTDALSEWFVNHYDKEHASETLLKILNIKSEEDFVEFVRKERQKDLNDDDTSLVIIQVSESNVLNESVAEEEETEVEMMPQTPIDVNSMQCPEKSSNSKETAGDVPPRE